MNNLRNWSTKEQNIEDMDCNDSQSIDSFIRINGTGRIPLNLLVA